MIDAHRTTVLDQQLQRWERAGRLTAYLAEMRTHVDQMTVDTERAAATEWLTWATAHAEQASPLRGTLHMPDLPTPTADNMKAHLGRWSYYGPGRH